MKTRPTILFFLFRESSGIILAFLAAISLLIFTIFLDNFLAQGIFLHIKTGNWTIHLCVVFFAYFFGFILFSLIFGTIRWKYRTNKSYVIPKTLLLTLFLDFFLLLHIALIFFFRKAGLLEHALKNIHFLAHEIAPLTLFALLFSFSIYFMSYVIRALGQDFFINSITNKFQTLKEFEGFVLFIDLNDSTPLIKQLGTKQFFAFQSDFFKDMELPAYYTGGQLMRYVGDESVTVWNTKAGMKDNNCLDMISLFKKNIAHRKDYYLKKYGVVPAFKACLHFGVMDKIAAGYNKVDVICTGRAFQICARVIAKCHELDSQLLLSDAAYQQLNFQNDSRFKLLGEFDLKGVSEKTEIYRANLD